MLSKKELNVVIDEMLRCVGYEFNGGIVSAKSGINGWIIHARPRGIMQKLENMVFEFIDEYSGDWANLNAVAWYEGEVLNFVVSNNFVHAEAPWYKSLPILQIVYDTENNTGWFMYRYHCVVGRIDKNKEFKANRITNILKQSTKQTLEMPEVIEQLKDCYDPDLTAEVLEKEIETKNDEKYGLPDIISFFKNRQML